MRQLIAQSALLKPLSYLLIENDHLKWSKVRFPGLMALGFVLIFFVASPHVDVFGQGGLVAAINGAIGPLIGFYIAALAAVATFENKSLDKKFTGQPVTINLHISGKEWQEELTRRRFLSLLFGYCSFMSIVLFVFGVSAQIFHTGVKVFLPVHLHVLIVGAFVAIYMFAFFNVLATTFLGLFYLADRLHRD